jgi:hypothetical protein
LVISRTLGVAEEPREVAPARWPEKGKFDNDAPEVEAVVVCIGDPPLLAIGVTVFCNVPRDGLAILVILVREFVMLEDKAHNL